MVNDAVGQMAESLKNIERYLAINGTGGMDGSGGAGGAGGAGGPGSNFIAASAYVIKETDDYDAVDEGGSVTVAPGDTVPLVEARASNDQPLSLMAVGAVDEPGVSYELVVDDNRVVGGVTNSPLGLLNDPFSFIEKLGGAIPAEKHVEYRATVAPDVEAPVELAARMHVNMYPGSR